MKIVSAFNSQTEAKINEISFFPESAVPTLKQQQLLNVKKSKQNVITNVSNFCVLTKTH